MAINPIAANVSSPPPVATPATSSPAPAATKRQPVAPEQPPVAVQSPQDSVQLSGAALARSLKIAGQTPTQIAMKMGIDIKTVNSYLSTTPAATASGAQQTAAQVAATPQTSSAEEAGESSIQKAIEG
ncbi:MAG: hypothetical protein M0Z90_04150 [Desulfobacteraceae bacterium]|nr:hypothetical protein [Desulfobacteraceae bacterium]